jgi:hypothetical protein
MESAYFGRAQKGCGEGLTCYAFPDVAATRKASSLASQLPLVFGVFAKFAFTGDLCRRCLPAMRPAQAPLIQLLPTQHLDNKSPSSKAAASALSPIKPGLWALARLLL